MTALVAVSLRINCLYGLHGAPPSRSCLYLFLLPVRILFCLIFIFSFYDLRPVLLLYAHQSYYVISM